jgi:hypothetical protein
VFFAASLFFSSYTINIDVFVFLKPINEYLVTAVSNSKKGIRHKCGDWSFFVTTFVCDTLWQGFFSL